MISSLYNNVNYLAPVDYILFQYIREYDISKANINILLYKGIISKDQYDYFYGLSRMERQITLGCMQRDNPEIAKSLTSGIIEAKKMFFEANEIQDYEVLSIKNDAVFLVGKEPINTKFDNIEFKCKNIYTSYYKLYKIEAYYYNTIIDKKDKLDLKGIGEAKQELHAKYFIDFLYWIFDMAQRSSIEDTIKYLQVFTKDYLNREYDIGYYRQFNAESKFLLHKFPGAMGSFKADFMDEKYKNYVDISYNEGILRLLNKIYMTAYFSKVGKI